MKLIIAGGRDLDIDTFRIGKELLGFNVLYLEDVEEIVSGKCRGIDSCGEKFAVENGIPIKEFPYESKYGKAGGPIRNKKMANYADALLLIWNGKSSGSRSMKAEMTKLGKPVYEVIKNGD